jgi:hypothetical protein
MFSLNQAGRFLEQASTVESLQRNMKAEYQVVFDFELAFYHTVGLLQGCVGKWFGSWSISMSELDLHDQLAFFSVGCAII